MKENQTAKTLTLSEFEQLCKERNAVCFTYDTTEQPGEHFTSGPYLSACQYTDLLVFYHPNVLVFKNKGATLYFRYVRNIKIIKDNPTTGMMIDIICNNPYEDKEESHRLTADFRTEA